MISIMVRFVVADLDIFVTIVTIYGFFFHSVRWEKRMISLCSFLGKCKKTKETIKRWEKRVISLCSFSGNCKKTKETIKRWEKIVVNLCSFSGKCKITKETIKKQLRYSSFSWTTNGIIQKIIMIYNSAFNIILFFLKSFQAPSNMHQRLL